MYQKALHGNATGVMNYSFYEEPVVMKFIHSGGDGWKRHQQQPLSVTGTSPENKINRAHRSSPFRLTLSHDCLQHYLYGQ